MITIGKIKKNVMENQKNVTVGIYKILSPSGKIYIGQSKDIERRHNQYRLLHCEKQPRLYNSLKKYGWEKHISEVIETCLIEQLDEREIFYKQQFIDEFGWTKALFCGLYDTGNGPKTKETCELISKAKKGKPVSESRKEKMRKPFSEYHKKALREGIIKSRGKDIIQYDLKGNFKKEYPSASTAERAFNHDQSSNISACANGKQKTAYGYIWKYKEN
jgi:group I intron endonuclease